MSNRIDVGLVSGGKDSTVTAHKADEEVGLDLLAYLDTRTGADDTLEYVQELADALDIQLWTLRTNESYEEWVEEHGFPGPQMHFMAYNKLKDRQLQKLATVCGGELHFYAGYRKSESDRRMRNVEPTQEYDRWTVHAPIHDFSEQDVWDYIETHDLPHNELWDTLGRSADCWCGAYGSPEELIDAEACGLEDVVSDIRDLESDIERDDERDVWGWGGMSNVEQRAARESGKSMKLCSDCSYPTNDS